MNAPIKLTTTWICDTCGETIEDVSHGFVEYLGCYNQGKHCGHGLRLVHHDPFGPNNGGDSCEYNRCRDDGMSVTNFNLHQFVGQQGLMDLLAMVAEGELPKEEVLEVIKRLHIDGYEQARRYFDDAVANGAFEPNTLKGYYNIIDIEATIRYVAKKR